MSTITPQPSKCEVGAKAYPWENSHDPHHPLPIDVAKTEPPANKKAFILGIAGGTASGKSTFAGLVAERLEQYSPKIVPMDNYFYPDEQKPIFTEPVTGKSYIDYNSPETVDFERLHADLAVLMEKEQLVICEGHLVLTDDRLYNLLDLKLYCECRADERALRRVARNMRYGFKFEDISHYYLSVVKYQHEKYVEPSKWRADIMLNGMYNSQLALNMVCGYVSANIEGQN